MTMRMLAALSAALFLISCGGGGGSSSGGPKGPGQKTPSGQDQGIAQYRAALGGDPLNLSPAQIRSTLQTRLAAADRLLITDFSGNTLAGPYRLATACSGGTCVSGGEQITIADFDPSEDDYVALMVRNGVSVAAASLERPIAGGGREVDLSLAGWTDHHAFGASFSTEADASNVATAVAFSGTSIGNDTGSNPVSGSATWRGVMTAYDTSDVANVLALQGDARLTVDFAASNLDASFTNIHDEDLARRRNIRFDDVPMTAGGFAQQGTNRSIEGTFYGPGHVEAGGVFEHGDTVGAFGALRE